VEFKMPASLRVGEAVEVDVKIGNNINSCMDVSFLQVYVSLFNLTPSNQGCAVFSHFTYITPAVKS
jgi:hypothetical protein